MNTMSKACFSAAISASCPEAAVAVVTHALEHELSDANVDRVVVDQQNLKRKLGGEVRIDFIGFAAHNRAIKS
jgi:hypothetical protein